MSSIPRISFRLVNLSEPFDEGGKVEATIDLVVRVGSTRIASQISHILPSRDVHGLPGLGDVWHAKFERGEG